MRLGHLIHRAQKCDAVKNRKHADKYQLKRTHNYPVYSNFLGDFSEEVTPVPIPHTAVKLLSADGTAWVTVWESRSSPGLFLKPRIA